MSATEPEPREEEKSAHHLGRTGPHPDEFANPAGVGGETCEVERTEAEVEPCDPAGAEDLVLEETKPGFGIDGYEGEEVGGG